MSTRIIWIVAIADLAAIIYIANLVRRKYLELKYALIWFLVGLLLLIFDLSPHLIYDLARLLGISLPINMLFFLGFGFVLMIIFTQTIVISNLTRKAKRLTQEVGLLNKRIDNLVERIHTDEEKQEAYEDKKIKSNQETLSNEEEN